MTTAKEILESLTPKMRHKRPSLNDQLSALPPVYGQAVVCAIDAGHDGLALAVICGGVTELWSGSIRDLDKASVWLHGMQDKLGFKRLITVREHMGNWRRGLAMNAAGNAVKKMIGATFPRQCRHTTVHPLSWQAKMGIGGIPEESLAAARALGMNPQNEHESDAGLMAHVADQIRKIVFGAV